MYHQFMRRLNLLRHAEWFARPDPVVYRDRDVVHVKDELTRKVSIQEGSLARRDIQMPTSGVGRLGHKCARTALKLHALSVPLEECEAYLIRPL